VAYNGLGMDTSRPWSPSTLCLIPRTAILRAFLIFLYAKPPNKKTSKKIIHDRSLSPFNDVKEFFECSFLQSDHMPSDRSKHAYKIG